MVKVTRIPLICQTTDKNGNMIDYKDIFHLLWELQGETRAIKNKVIQLLWEWNNFSSDYYKQHGSYPDNKEILGYKGGIRSYLYDRLKSENIMNTANFTATLDCARIQFQAYIKEYLKGTRSIIEYKNNQPLELHNNSISLEKTDSEYIFDLSILSKIGAKAKGFPLRFKFKGIVKDKSIRDILDRCLDNTYKICASRLVYDKKKKWCINLAYGFESAALSLDKNKILGIDLGVQKPFMASVYGDMKRFFVEGGKDGEIEVFRRKTEARKRSLLRHGQVCGDGSIGHGYKTRTKPANNIADKIARFRDTVNHKYSRAIVDYAVKNNCGVIQMEKLSGITAETESRYLKNWSYYDLQMKIENKAKEAGIEVIYVEPKYTSQRCSVCGYIHKENRPEQARFKCQKCGFEENADYNASQNIATKDIDKLIAEAIKAQNNDSADEQ